MQEYPWRLSEAAIAASTLRQRAVRARVAAEQRALRKDRAETIERWGHKRNGTIETHEAHRRRSAGAMARLHASKAIDDDMLAHAQEIAAVVATIAADVCPRTASLETRVDVSRHGDAGDERMGAIWREMAYTRWRKAIGPECAAMALDVIAHDVGLTRAAARHGMHMRRARRLLVDALELWPQLYKETRRTVSVRDVAIARVRMMMD